MAFNEIIFAWNLARKKEEACKSEKKGDGKEREGERVLSAEECRWRGVSIANCGDCIVQEAGARYG